MKKRKWSQCSHFMQEIIANRDFYPFIRRILAWRQSFRKCFSRFCNLVWINLPKHRWDLLLCHWVIYISQASPVLFRTFYNLVFCNNPPLSCFFSPSSSYFPPWLSLQTCQFSSSILRGKWNSEEVTPGSHQKLYIWIDYNSFFPRVSSIHKTWMCAIGWQ